jgi:catechol 2,3-dioxygenase-like lactoylglutathione lyase family enzyme
MDFPIAQIRIARPTDKLEEVVRFYHEGLLFPVIGSFQKHAGYDGIMLGMPDGKVHLEFTQHESGSPCPAPTKDNLLVLYFSSKEERDADVSRLADLGYGAVEPENPYWIEHGITVEDPDGWRVVLFDKAGF